MSHAITAIFAFKVRDFNRLGLSVPAIACQTRASEADVMESHRLLYLAVDDSQPLATVRTDEQRAADLDRMPKRMQDRMRRSRQ